MSERNDADALDTWLSFADLEPAGIVDSWQTLPGRQKDPEIRFPAGKLFGPNSRRWSKQKDIDPWLEFTPHRARGV